MKNYNQKYVVTFTLLEIKQMLELIEDKQKECWYNGYKKQYEKRVFNVEAKLRDLLNNKNGTKCIEN